MIKKVVMKDIYILVHQNYSPEQNVHLNGLNLFGLSLSNLPKTISGHYML